MRSIDADSLETHEQMEPMGNGVYECVQVVYKDDIDDAPTIEPERKKGYECFHCGEQAVIWDGDFSFKDYCEEGEGIIQECHCANCGAQITYRISLNGEDQ